MRITTKLAAIVLIVLSALTGCATEGSQQNVAKPTIRIG